MKHHFVWLVGAVLLGASAWASATHFTFYVDPVTGDTQLFVHSGVVAGRDADRGADGAVPSEPTNIYGGFGSYFPDSRSGDLPPPPVFHTDPNDVTSIADEAVIRALLENRSQLQQQNEDMMVQLRDYLTNQGYIDPGEGSDEYHERFQRNLDNLISHIIRQAGESQLDIAALIEQFNHENPDQRRALDDIPPPVDSRPGSTERERLEQMRQQREEQMEAQRRQREDMAERNRELLDKIKDRQQQLQEQNERVAEERRRQAEERYTSALDEKERERFEQAQREREAARERASQRPRPPGTDPNAPATPESYQDHIAAVAGPNGANPPGVPNVPREPPTGAQPGETQSDYANEVERDEGVEVAAEDYLAGSIAWEDYLVNSGGQITEESPTESIYGDTVGTYNGLVRGEFEGGPRADGTMQMDISFDTLHVDGNIVFDHDQGGVALEGNADGARFWLGLYGNAFGGEVEGNFHGWMYGANAEEVGGEWDMSVSGGALDGEAASGEFAAKQ